MYELRSSNSLLSRSKKNIYIYICFNPPLKLNEWVVSEPSLIFLNSLSVMSLHFSPFRYRHYFKMCTIRSTIAASLYPEKINFGVVIFNTEFRSKEVFPVIHTKSNHELLH